MLGTRFEGLSHLYLDSSEDKFSNVALGLLIRAIGAGLKVAYVDVLGGGTRFTNFLENLSLSSNFVKCFDRLSVETFVFKRDGLVLKGLIPAVEFFTISKDMFWANLGGYDLIIFDNCVFDVVSKFKILNFLDSRDEQTEAVFIFKKENEFDQICDHFDLVSKYSVVDKKGLILKSSIINICGEGKGKSTYSFGYLVKRFLEKKDVKLIYFDKGGEFYSERVFFRALKQWAKFNSLYGSFDFVVTGKPRFSGKKFRFENTEEDIVEAKEGLMLLKTALKKQTPVIADELNTTIKTGLLSEREVLDVLSEVKNELVITGRYSAKSILDVSSKIVEVVEISHYMKKQKGVRKGIDF